MKKIYNLIVVSILFLTGCATTEISTEIPTNISTKNKTPTAVILAENYGYYLFGILPIVTGSPDKPNETSLTFFEDTATIDNNQKMINLEAKKLNADTLIDVRHHTSWTGGFSLWIIWKQVLSSNALALKNEQPNQ